MEAVLIVGTESPFLRILTTVLSRSSSVRAVNTGEALEEVLVSVQPDVVIFDHTQPIDMFEMNPRRFGFTGPILLLADDPGTAAEVLQADFHLRRPSDLLKLVVLVRELAARQRPASA